MPYDPNKHHRRSIRLRGYDYAGPGCYFVTIYVQGRRCLFGTIVEGESLLNDAGRMVAAVWEALPEQFPMIVPDVSVVMPNHFHAVVSIVEALVTPQRNEESPSRSLSLGDTIGAFKSLTTNAYMRGVHERGWPSFDRRLWQRNYDEQIVRGEAALAQIRSTLSIILRVGQPTSCTLRLQCKRS